MQENKTAINTQEKLLETKKLQKVFVVGGGFARSKLLAVDDVNFHIYKNEIFTLAGESGCGKSTVSKMLLGFLEPTQGEVYYKGKDIVNLKKWEEKKEFMKEVQSVFQNPFETFNPLRKVDRYLYDTAKQYGITKNGNGKRVEEALKAVGLSMTEVKGRYPNEFSGGQLQRISVARSLITTPSLLVADEPVSMVDASLRMSIVNLFKDLRDKYNVSVLYITHDLATAYYVSDRIGIMFRGNIIEMGGVEEVLMNPKHPYTQMLKESIPEPDPKKKWTERISIKELETEEYMRKGCKFAGRCPFVMEKCKDNMPPEIQTENRMVRCWLYENKGDK
ncbi:ABC transporter ATP-binding protein [Petrotoga olearia]|uniref:Peptide ABC transporter ATP-binding protein n=2 Tax=Petrotoga olearia TaxID=156203 RepID=A0A2K1NXB9_9BACT|nr:ABC transporter ATP-binding protein [Petrotoga olearia]PNR95087.1 peptide ABC transporter ATP-binding protein [Petrotoga olearia DSM 13574]RMA72866.1 peptide/nickel transport system ATP-binding protein [Petrotoga olearia]